MRLAHFSQLVQRLLGGSLNEGVRNCGTTRSATRRQSMARGSNSTMCARGLIAGTILHIGPSYSDYIAMSEASNRWKLSLEKYYDAGQPLKTIRQLDDRYKAKLLDWEYESVSKFGGNGSEISWGESCDESWLTGLERTAQNYQSMPTSNSNVSSSNPVSSRTGPQRHLADNYMVGLAQTDPQRYLADNYIMGLAPPGAQEGDVICRFWLTDAAAVMRPKGESGRFKFIGRAHVTSSTRWEDKSPYYQERRSTSRGGVMNVHMDADSLQRLTC
jgi:hypothetical protein